MYYFFYEYFLGLKNLLYREARVTYPGIAALCLVSRSDWCSRHHLGGLPYQVAHEVMERIVPLFCSSRIFSSVSHVTLAEPMSPWALSTLTELHDMLWALSTSWLSFLRKPRQRSPNPSWYCHGCLLHMVWDRSCISLVAKILMRRQRSIMSSQSHGTMQQYPFFSFFFFCAVAKTQQ